MPVDQCADALHAHPALVYESIARLFYSSFTDDDESKARAVGVELNEKGGDFLVWHPLTFCSPSTWAAERTQIWQKGPCKKGSGPTHRP